MRNTIIIESNDNPDYNGKWTKDDVEQEMRELDCPCGNETDWIFWVLDHIFEEMEIDLENAVANPHFVSMKVKFSDGHATIKVR